MPNKICSILLSKPETSFYVVRSDIDLIGCFSLHFPGLWPIWDQLDVAVVKSGMFLEQREAIKIWQGYGTTSPHYGFRLFQILWDFIQYTWCWRLRDQTFKIFLRFGWQMGACECSRMGLFVIENSCWLISLMWRTVKINQLCLRLV